MWDFTQPQIDQQILTNNAVITLYIQFLDKKTHSVIVTNFTFLGVLMHSLDYVREVYTV